MTTIRGPEAGPESAVRRSAAAAVNRSQRVGPSTTRATTYALAAPTITSASTSGTTTRRLSRAPPVDTGEVCGRRVAVRRRIRQSVA